MGFWGTNFSSKNITVSKCASILETYILHSTWVKSLSKYSLNHWWQLSATHVNPLKGLQKYLVKPNMVFPDLISMSITSLYSVSSVISLMWEGYNKKLRTAQVPWFLGLNIRIFYQYWISKSRRPVNEFMNGKLPKDFIIMQGQ